MTQSSVEHLGQEHIRAASFWEIISDEQRQRLNANKLEIFLKKNDVIYHENEIPRFIYYVKEGVVKIFREGKGARPQILRFIPSDGLFGYRAALSDEKYVATSAAFEAATIYAFPIEVVKQLILETPQLALFLLSNLARELGIADCRLVGMTQKHLRGRLAETILFLRDTFGVCDERQWLRIQLTRQDWANLSNMTTSNAIRTFLDLAKEDVIAMAGRDIRILDEKRLHRISTMG